MPDIPISQLPVESVASATDVVPIVNAGVTKQVQVGNLLSASSGSSLVGFLQAGTGAVARTVQSKERETVSPSDFGTIGDGVTNDTAAWTAFTNYVQDGTGRRGFIPPGVYLIDSWAVGGYGGRFEGAAMGITGVAGGVEIRCRSICTDFVTFNGIGQSLSNVYINGNNKATNTVHFKETLSDLTFSKVTTNGCVDGGCNWNFTPTTPGSQVDLSSFYDCLITGRAGGTGITNIIVNSTETLRLRFYNPTITNAYYGIQVQQGGVCIYEPFFTANAINDVYFAQGQLDMFGGRSESTCDSVQLANGTAARVLLDGYVHAATPTTYSLKVAAGFTGKCAVINGRYEKIVIDATTGVSFFNTQLAGAGTITGASLNNYVWIDGTRVFLGSLGLSGSAADGELSLRNQTAVLWADVSGTSIAAQHYANNIGTVADNGIAVVGRTNGPNAFVLINEGNAAESAIVLLRGGIHAVSIVSDPLGVYSTTAGTASKINVYWSAGNSRYEIENKRGSARSFSAHVFG